MCGGYPCNRGCNFYPPPPCGVPCGLPPPPCGVPCPPPPCGPIVLPCARPCYTPVWGPCGPIGYKRYLNDPIYNYYGLGPALQDNAFIGYN